MGPQIYLMTILLFNFQKLLHTPIISNPSKYNYIALRKICISLNSANIMAPYGRPANLYFEWNTTFRYHLEDLSSYEIRKQILKTLMNKAKIISLLSTQIKLVFIQIKNL